MTLFGNGRIALAGDAATAGKLGWGRRKRSASDPVAVLTPRQGNPAREPWVCPPWLDPRAGVASLWRRGRGGWTYLSEPPGVLRELSALAAPPPAAWRIGVIGLGRVGGVAAATVAAMTVRQSRVRELLIHDVDAANLERWRLELGSVGLWRGREALPAVRVAGAEELFRECDAVLFVATQAVPPLGVQGDVRLVQLAPNRAILRTYLDHAAAANFAGLLLVVSDPVDWLAQAAFVDSNTSPGGAFSGAGLPPERIAGLGLGVMWARALAAAREAGSEARVRASGGAYGPHSVDVLAFDDLRRPDSELSACMTEAARRCNYRVRSLGFLPYVGPGVSSVALTLPRLLAGRQVAAAALVDGVYLGCPCRLEWGVYPAALRLGREVREAVAGLHRRLQEQAPELGLWPPALR
ncbi:MAG TPA: hypothetical protein P5234_01535 [Thermoanaerobaculaceae bacterium]|nr:hypothetical protein [Thermoanaerobaculaceae bacterium]HRS14908.1 hypothetical protein [Thermoanaerobaculaceae bacterium]